MEEREVATLLSVLAFSYGAAVLGLLIARGGCGWRCRRGAGISSAEAAWWAFLPALAMLVAPLGALLQPHVLSPMIDLHGAWHAWEERVHATPITHSILHAGNSLCLAAAAYGLGCGLYLLVRMRAFTVTVRAAAKLRSGSEGGAPLYTLASPRPACFALGVFRPAVYVTTGLEEQLSARECQAMLAHEAAHISRRDGLVGALLAGFYHLVPLPGSAGLQTVWAQAVERACDADAARQIGSPTDVAAALVRVARLMGSATPTVPSLVAFAPHEDLPGRVAALLAMPGEGRALPADRSLVPARLMAVSLGLLLAASVPLRHLVELFAHH
jgi:Zn-dependent protease with chaperone function